MVSKFISSIVTANAKYKTGEMYTNAVKEFVDENDLWSLRIEKFPEVCNFMLSATHCNGACLLRNKDDIPELSELKEIDLKASYASVKNCTFYEGFPNKITGFRPTNTVYGPGFYRITNIDYSQKFVSEISPFHFHM